MSKEMREHINKVKNFGQFINENKKETMKKYDDYKTNKSERDLTKEELNKIDWTKYKIIVPTEKDKKDLEDAFEHIHYSDIDTDFITVNQLAHEYLNDEVAEGTYNNIIVDETLFKSIENRRG
jgi:hypothetical protein